jgi:hypothetical protein
MVFSDSYQLPSPPFSLFRWVPTTPAWYWLWHLREAVCGKIKPVQVDADIIALSQTLTPALGAPTFDGPGSLQASRLRTWLLETADLKSLRQQFKSAPGTTFLNSPRITSGDGITASLFTGQATVINGVTNETGVWVTCVTRVRKDVIDLTALMQFVEPLTNRTSLAAVRTNLNVKARFQIPKNKGLFLLESSEDETNRPPIGVIIWTQF